MRAIVVLTLTSLCGCSQTSSTPPGALPRPSLLRSTGQPPAPADADSARSEVTVETCRGAPFLPASLKVSWERTTRDPDGWIRDVQVELLDAPEGLIVELAPTVTVGGANLEPNAPWVDVADVAVSCTRRQFRFPRQYDQSLKGLVQLKASGEFSVDGSPWTPAGQPKG
ncbi:MAG: hypothetical protein SFW67_22235 [Myxococcaceae bacterium]|nr:hypothetical protein [Myxococcaceae bacterium]